MGTKLWLTYYASFLKVQCGQNRSTTVMDLLEGSGAVCGVVVFLEFLVSCQRCQRRFFRCVAFCVARRPHCSKNQTGGPAGVRMASPRSQTGNRSLPGSLRSMMGILFFCICCRVSLLGFLTSALVAPLPPRSLSGTSFGRQPPRR